MTTKQRAYLKSLAMNMEPIFREGKDEKKKIILPL